MASARVLQIVAPHLCKESGSSSRASTLREGSLGQMNDGNFFNSQK